MTATVQLALDGSIPEPAKSRARQQAEDYETWAATVRPTFAEIAKTGQPFLFWKVARDHELPDPPDRDHDWGRFAAALHKDGLIRVDGYGHTRDKSAVRRWRGTAAAMKGHVA
ncbi:hypothetical protein [Streptomyces sp. PD-S100-1]|uniref:hypothetical protein n=1 Tax=Streptomyces sp. PD-S100-1 TaxID=3394351 RepID=UPI0039BCEBED